MTCSAASEAGAFGSRRAKEGGVRVQNLEERLARLTGRFLVFSPDGTCRGAPAAAAQALGRLPGELIGKTLGPNRTLVVCNH